MKKFNLFLISILIGAVFFAGCGKNEKKTSLLTGTVNQEGEIALPTTQEGTAATASAKSANLAAMSGGGVGAGGFLASHRAISKTGLADLGVIDSEGFYTIPAGFTATTMKISFLKSDGSYINFSTLTGPPSITKIRVKVTTVYSFGTFNGNFLISNIGTATETMESGVITCADPLGGNFTATMSNMVMERVTINGANMGLPISGTMAISGSTGYSGTNTYSKVGSTYKCEGPIYYPNANTKVADVYLTFNSTLGNYTGYYVNVGTDTAQHLIE